MRARRAAPGELPNELLGDARIEGNACILSCTTIPTHIAERLAAEGVTTLEQWRGLGGGRKKIFGITRAMGENLDRLTRDAPKTSRSPSARGQVLFHEHARRGAAGAT